MLFIPVEDEVAAPTHWDDLVHWWTLDDDGAWADSVGSLDLSESGTVGTTAGDPSGETVADIDSGEGLHFQNVPSWTHGNAMSMAVWFNADALESSPGAFFMTYRDNPSNQRLAQLLHREDGTVQANVFGVDAQNIVIRTPGVCPAGEWHHALLTTDGASLHRVYIDGALEVTSTTAKTGNFPTTTTDFAFGIAGWDLSTLPYNGKLWGGGIWSRALTAAEAASLYNGGAFLEYTA